MDGHDRFMDAHGLADPPWLVYFLFESPVELGAVFGVAAAVLLLLARYRGIAWAPKAAGGCLLVCVAVVGLAYFVETDREEITRLTQRLVELSVPLDTASMRSLFTDDATLSGPDGRVLLEVDEIFKEVEALDRRHPILEQTVLHIKAEAGPTDRGRVLLTLRTKVDLDIAERAFRTVWMVHWTAQHDGQWRVIQVQWVRAPDPALIRRVG